MNQKKVERVVIVGGGTAGWMAATALGKLIGKNIKITLIESDEIATVGVGEATIPPLLTFHQLLDIKEEEFMAAVQGTFKLGINFENWRNVKEDYFHSFGFTGKDCWAGGFQHFWLKGLEKGLSGDYGEYCLELQAAKASKFAHLPNAQLNYAYHMDAGLYAKFLRKIAEHGGPLQTHAERSHVSTDADTDFIESVTLMSGEVVAGDLFIDCSGFRGLLIEQTLHTGYEDWSHWLPCDSAVAVQTKSVGPAVPYTRSIAHPFGWQWRIPLQHRVGNGLVFCSRYLSDEDAKKTLLQNVEGEPINEPRIIKFRAGQRLKHWNKNCVALGLASGFIEPLESTSIHLIQKGIIRLIQLFPVNGVEQADIDEFNKQSKFETDNIRDFIILHYHVTNRTDSRFWNYCRNMPVPESLAHRIELYRKTGKVFKVQTELFGENSWNQVMLGQGIMPEGHHAIADMLTDEELKDFLDAHRSPIKRVLSQMPSHHDFIQHYCRAEKPM